MLSLTGTEHERSNDDILTLYFPFKNPKEVCKEYKLYFDEKLEKINSINEHLTQSMNKYDHTLDSNIELFRIQNLVLYSIPIIRNDIDLENIFKNLEFDEKISFIHYYDIFKNNIYRVNKASIFPNLTKINYDTYSKILNSIKSMRSELSGKNNLISSIKRNINLATT